MIYRGIDLTSGRLEHYLSRRQAVRTGGAGLVASALAATGLARMGRAQDATPAASPVASPVASPTASPVAAAPSWEGIDRQLAAAAPSTGLLAAELIGGACQHIHASNADAVLPVGSSFKLWVLGALALEVEAGRIDWEQPLTIEQQHKSVPGGDLRFVPNGTVFTVRYVAERMMQKSDNTATDHIMALVGREKIEQTMAAMGHHDPSLNIPLITTRELAFLKFATPTDRLDAYYAAPVAERRQILATEIDTMPEEALADTDQTAPLEIDRVEWFATRDDLCQAMAWLWNQAQKPGMLPVKEIIALETQLPFAGEVWPYVGFKGGSEMGVLSGTWLLQRADGRHFVYSIGFKDSTAALDMAAAVVVMEAGRDRLAQTP